MEQQRQRQIIQVQQWNSCCLDRCDGVYILTFTGDDQHLFNPSTIAEMLAALTVVEQSPDARALITTNEGRFFSNGLDLLFITKDGSFSPAAADIILDFYGRCLSSMMKLGIPTIAAVCGHASAGAFMLALAHDYRFMMNGTAVLYMTELDNAMLMPRSFMAVIRSKLLPASVREMVLKARKFTASEAFEFGIVDGFYNDSAKTLEAAIAEAEKLASRNWNRESYANLRNHTFPDVIKEIEADRDRTRYSETAKL